MKKKVCNSGIGGQAVLEGVMMKNKEAYAIAVRKQDGEIDLEITEYHGVMHGSVLTKVPFIRGVFNFIDSFILGMRSINHSADLFGVTDDPETGFDRFMKKLFKDKAEKVTSGLTVLLSVILALGLFIFLPYYLSSILERYIMNSSLLALVEGLIRLVIFLLYLLAISLLKDIRRLFMYHGAEHKCINCIEHGHELTVENVKKASRLHKRCGTSFLLFVMVISIILFMFIKVDNPALRIVFRLLLIPVIAGISYEVIKLAGRSNNVIVNLLSAPGLALQFITTKEPDEDMIEVAIKSVEGVFDWKNFLEEKFG
ncbi:MAG: DUF1385 domain-containing protein [Lachnospiraceae bacterium]|nr:DUF1385 domain-containing protein [Lachnospiraceae bacterium]